MQAERAESACPVRGLLNRFGDSWSVAIINLLSSGPVRFNELRRKASRLHASSEISARMLTLTLRNLERDGFVHRSVSQFPILKVEYGLTELGSSFSDLFLGICEWHRDNENKIHASQRRYDQRGTE